MIRSNLQENCIGKVRFYFLLNMLKFTTSFNQTKHDNLPVNYKKNAWQFIGKTAHIKLLFINISQLVTARVIYWVNYLPISF